MSGRFLLDWASFTISLFNTILLLWLGLTVLLNAEKRTWGIWLAGGGLLTGAIFFVSHSVLLTHNQPLLSGNVEFWWRVGWAPLIALPYAWYTLMLWYTGFWGATAGERSPAQRGQRLGWFAATASASGLAAMILLSRALPSYVQLVQLDVASIPTVRQMPLLIAGYPLYALFCMGLSLGALANPAPSPRVMGDIARRRARPWLVATSIALMAASLLVAAAMGWIAVQIEQRTPSTIHYLITGLAWFDMITGGCIAAAVVLLGKAIISYEIFTGHNLPRRGFLRHWRRAVVLASGYSAVVGWSLVANLQPVYSLLLTVLVMTTFYALLVWRTFGDRERALAQLHPFVSSQGLYEDLLRGNEPPEAEAAGIFRALCEGVLGASGAQLVPVGPSAPLAGPPLTYPADARASPLPSRELVERLRDRATAYVPVPPERYAGAAWAIPLRHERGLTGMLLLGEKSDGGLYTQEEIEIARASGERLIDLRSGVEMARRLMALQRQRLAETQIVDQRTRRILHDEVLPRLHAAMLVLQGDPGDATSETIALLSETHRRVADLLRDMPAASAPEVARWGIVEALRRTVGGELGGHFEGVRWEVGHDAEARLRELPPLISEVLFYAAREAIRNAAHHGRAGEGSRRPALAVSFEVEAWGKRELVVRICDDGPGIQAPGGAVERRGQGLALHSTMMAVVGGTLKVNGAPSGGTCVTLRLPSSPPGDSV